MVVPFIEMEDWEKGRMGSGRLQSEASFVDVVSLRYLSENKYVK